MKSGEHLLWDAHVHTMRARRRLRIVAQLAGMAAEAFGRMTPSVKDAAVALVRLGEAMRAAEPCKCRRDHGPDGDGTYPAIAACPFALTCAKLRARGTDR